MIASWTICTDFQHQQDRIRSRGQLLATWSGFDASELPTLCFRDEDGVWITRDDRGGIRFTQHEYDLQAYPKEGIDREKFKRLVFHEWLPFVYNFWGFQVLHASATVHSPSGQVVGFSGASGAGKSTFGFGLGCLKEWRQIADDSLAFSAQTNSVRLLPIPNEVYLRPATARHYRDKGTSDKFLDWTDSPLRLKRIFFLEPSDDLETPVRLLPLSRARAYVCLLQQAYQAVEEGVRSTEMRDRVGMSK